MLVIVTAFLAGFSCMVHAQPGSPVAASTPKSDVFIQGFYWNSPPGGAWWDSLARLAPGIGAAGFGAIWFPPATKGQAGGFSMGYDPYDHYDFGEFNQHGSVETRFGSRAELVGAINAFHSVGVQVFADAVMGHMNGAEQKIPIDCSPYPGYPDSAYLLFNYPNGSGRFRKNATHFYPNQQTCDVNPPYHGPYDPIFKFGEILAHTQSHVRDSLITWGQYLRNVIGFDGFRIDAVKHIDPMFIGPWVQATGGYAVCEYFGSTAEIATWLHYCQNVFGGDVSMFDFPLRFTLKDMCNNTSGTFDMNWLDGAGLVNAGLSGFDVATFVENHDLDRTGWDGSVDNGHSPILFNKDMAYSYILFSEGRPCVFFRDYFVYGLNTSINRLIWIREKFLGGTTTKRDGLSPWYVGSPASQLDQSRDIYVARRNGGNGKPQSFIVINDNPYEWRGVWVNSDHPNQVFRDYTGVAIDKQAAADGRVELWAPPRGFAVYVPDTTQRVNHHPYIHLVPDLTAFSETSFQFQTSAGDLNGDPINYSLSGNPPWLTVSAGGLLNGIPGIADTTTSIVVLTVSDPWGGSSADTFAITVRSRPLMDGVFEGSGVWSQPVAFADTVAGWDGVRAKDVYVIQDENYVYFGAHVRARQWMNWGFLINTRPEGGSSESWSRSITYSHNNRPDFVLRGHFQGYAEFHTWNGSGWTGVGTPLASTEFGESLVLDSLDDGWVEGRVLRSVLGNPGGLQVQLYLTGNQNANATFDACPDDQNTTGWTGVMTSLRRYAFAGTKEISGANLQFPPDATITGGGSATIYGRVFALGVTDSAGPGQGLLSWIGYSAGNTHPSTWVNWIPAAFNVDAGAFDEYQANIGANLPGGTYYYATRFQFTGGPYLFGGYSSSGGGFWNGTGNVSGVLTVQAPPATPLPASPFHTATNVAPNVTLVWNPSPGLNTYRLQVSTDSLFAAPVLDDSTITGSSRQLGSLSYSTTYYWRVRAKNTYGVSSYSARWSFTVFTPVNATVKVTPAWNALSVPLTVLDGRKSVLFPSSTSGAFAFSSIGGYTLRDSLHPGTGYWLKFPASDSVIISGGVRSHDSIQVQSGWNLIGSISTTIPVASILQFPDSIVRSLYYRYQSGYSPVDSISPSRAYWVKTAASGKLVLATGGAFYEVARGESIIDHLGGYSSLTIRDAEGNSQTLYFGFDDTSKEMNEAFELPPTPPAGVFDVRFSNQRLYNQLRKGSEEEFRITIASARHPLEISWSSKKQDPPVILLVEGGRILLAGEGRVGDVLADHVVLRFADEGHTPRSYSLDQNYPNPFNPSTTIRFSLPFASYVRLTVYDMLGREVSDLSPSEIMDAGTHAVTFDGENLGSGVYFCKLAASSIGVREKAFLAVAKMLLIK